MKNLKQELSDFKIKTKRSRNIINNKRPMNHVYNMCNVVHRRRVELNPSIVYSNKPIQTKQTWVEVTI